MAKVLYKLYFSSVDNIEIKSYKLENLNFFLIFDCKYKEYDQLYVAKTFRDFL